MKDSISFSFKILQSLDLPVLNLPVDLLAPLEFFGFRCLETKIFISWQLKVDTLAKTSSYLVKVLTTIQFQLEK